MPRDASCLAILAAAILAGTVPAAEPVDVIVLHGSLRAADAERHSVPMTSSWQLPLTWLIDEGTVVEPGQEIARFDPAGTADNLAEAEEQLRQKEQELLLQAAESELARLGHELALVRAETAHEKARVDAAVPEEALEGVEYRDRQIALQRAAKGLADARRAIETHREQEASQRTALEVEIARLRREIADLETELDTLGLRAGRAGIVVHEEHPWWGRKVRLGDQLQATFPVASIPDLSSLEVEVWASEVDVPRLAVGQLVRLRLDAQPDLELGGRVVEIGRAGEDHRQWGSSSRFRVRVDLEDRQAGDMKPGMSVRCEIALATPAEEGS
jgi:multidrug resistance efflux pump